MAWPKNENRDAMYKMYLEGYSLAQVAEYFGRTRQSVFGLFKNHGLKTRLKKELPCIEYNGFKYTMRNTGYYGKTFGDRTLLHRDMWQREKGEIPDGYDIHHKDGNKTNNQVDNFECLLKADHTKKHSHGQNQHTKNRGEKCGA